MLLEMFYHMLLPKLHWEGGGAQAEEGVEFPQCYYSPQQCSAFEMALDMIKVGEYWMAYISLHVIGIVCVCVCSN